MWTNLRDGKFNPDIGSGCGRKKQGALLYNNILGWALWCYSTSPIRNIRIKENDANASALVGRYILTLWKWDGLDNDNTRPGKIPLHGLDESSTTRRCLSLATLSLQTRGRGSILLIVQNFQVTTAAAIILATTAMGPGLAALTGLQAHSMTPPATLTAVR